MYSNTPLNHTTQISGNAVPNINLSGNKARDIKTVTKLMVDIVKRQRRLARKEIKDLKAARYARYHTEIPRNYAMEEVYKDALLDGHLTGITENRTLRTTNKPFVFAIDNIKDDKLTQYIEDKKWFEDVKQYAHVSSYHGHSLIWVKNFDKGEIKEVELIDRGLVLAEQRILLYDYDADKGIDFSELKDILLYAQFYDPVGILEKAAVFTILKRHSWGSWDEFEEMFGVPIRIAKIASSSEPVKNEIAGWLEEMGSAAYGVFPLGTEVEIKENTKSDAFNVFYKKIEALDKEMSKLVLHQTMTTENGSSKAQGSVHENTLKEVIKADEKKMLAFLNEWVVPAMRNHGYNIPENAKIIVEKITDPKEQILTDQVLIKGGYVLNKEYLEKTYGTQIDSLPRSKQNELDPKPDPEEKGKG